MALKKISDFFLFLHYLLKLTRYQIFKPDFSIDLLICAPTSANTTAEGTGPHRRIIRPSKAMVLNIYIIRQIIKPRRKLGPSNILSGSIGSRVVLHMMVDLKINF